MSNKYPGGIITSGANAGYSVAFDGNGDSLTAPQSNSFRFSGNFTIEAWVYANSSAGGSNYDGVFDTRSGNVVSSASAGINYTPSGYLNAYVAGSNLTSSTLLGANRWVHVALVRSGSAVTLYQNGISVATGTTSANLTDGYCTVGGFVANGYWNGYISNVRVVNGTAVYSGSSTTTANFALPTQLFPITNTSFLTCQSPSIVDNSVNAATITANGNAAVSTFTPFQGYVAYNPALGAATPGIWSVSDAIQAAQTRRWNMYDPYFNLTTLLLHGNGTNGAQNNTFLDSSSNNFTITRNGNTTQGTFSPFSQTGWSNYFNGSTDYLTTPDAAQFDFGTGDFTIEFFVYIAANSGLDGGSERWAAIITSLGTGSATDSGFGVYINGNGTTTGTGITFENRINSTTNYTITATTTVNQNAWNHIAVARSGTTTTIYLNGTSVGSGTLTNQTITSSQTINIGRLNVSTYTRYLNGYLSNLRVVKGTAVYTSSFTVPTTALTNITNTSLLTCQSNRFIDNSTNAFTITVNGTPSVQAFSPFYPVVAYTPQAQGGSGYFDGTGDYVTWPSGSSVAFGTGDFTVETFFYLTTTPAGSLYFIDARDASNTTAWAFHIAGATSIIWFNGSAQFAVTLTMPINQWNHIAYVRSGTTGALYFNGTRVSTQTDSTNYTVQPGTSYVASRYNAIEQFPGYFSGTRIVKGTAAYSGTTYTVPTAPLTAITNTTLLLNYTNAGIIDSTAKNVLETVGNAQISTTQSKFGGSSISFDGTGDYLIPSATSSTLNAFGSGDFTVEFWIYFNSVTGTQQLIDFRPSGTQGAYISLYSNGSSGINLYVSSADRITGNSTLSTSTWYHVALARSGTSTKLFINGTQVGSTYTDSTVYLCGSGRPCIGIYGGDLSSYGLNGYIDDLRITKGYARYTANFTAQTSQWQDQ